jgi:O-antigen/teichoic acid export membrane protein
MATLAQTYVYAKVLSPQSFGVFALVQATCLMAQALQRSAVVLPMIVTSEHRNAQVLWSRVDLGVRAVIFGALAILALVAAKIGISPDFRAAMILASICSLSVLAFEFERRCLFLQQRSSAVLKAAIVNFIGTAIVVAVVAAWWREVEAAALGLFFSSAVAAIVARHLRAPLEPSSETLRKQLPSISWNIASFVPYAVYNNGMVLIIGVLIDTRAVALFAASRLFTAPVQALLQAVDSVDKPRARRMFFESGLEGLSESLSRTRRSLLVIGLPYLLLVVVGADVLTEMLFGNSFPGMSSAVMIFSGVSLLMLLSQPLDTGLLILKRPDVLFYTRVAAAAAAIAALLALQHKLPTLAPVASLLVGWSVGGASSWTMLRVLKLRRSHHE